MESRLYLETAVKQERTYIKDMYFTSPYKIMSPFAEENHIDIVLMSASAGLLSGDSFVGELKFLEGSDVTYLSQSYEKVFCKKQLPATKKITMEVGSGARVKYLPYPMIPFAGSDFSMETSVNLKADATFVYGDIFTCGRTGMGEYFQMECYESRAKIYVEEKLAFADHTLICPKKFHYSTLGMWNQYTHNGILYVHIPDKNKELEIVEEVRKNLVMEQGIWGISECCKGIAVRILAMSGEEIYGAFQWISDKI